MVILVGFLALAIDVGMMAIAKTQVQQTADLAVLTAMRTLNGNSSINYNQTAATTNAQNVVTYNTILGQSVAASQLQLTFGSYDYSSTTSSFSANFPADERCADDRGFGDDHHDQLAGHIQQHLPDATPPQRHGDGPSRTPTARHRPGDGPFRLDADGHLPRI